MNGHKPPLLSRYFFSPSHRRGEICVLADDNGNVIFLLVSVRYQIDGQANISAFLTAMATHRAAGNDNPLIAQTPKLAVPELMPSP